MRNIPLDDQQIIGGLIAALGLILVYVLVLRVQLRESRQFVASIAAQLQAMSKDMHRLTENVVCPPDHCRRAVDGQNNTIAMSAVQDWGKRPKR